MLTRRAMLGALIVALVPARGAGAPIAITVWKDPT